MVDRNNEDVGQSVHVRSLIKAYTVGLENNLVR